MRVQAIARGYYGDRIIDAGTQFELRSPEHYSHVWMKALDGEPEKDATAKVVKRAKKAVKKPPTFA